MIFIALLALIRIARRRTTAVASATESPQSSGPSRNRHANPQSVAWHRPYG